MNIHVEIGPGLYADLERIAPGESPAEQIHTALDQRDKLLEALEIAQNDCDTIAADLCADDPPRWVERQAQLLAGVAMLIRKAMQDATPAPAKEVAP